MVCNVHCASDFIFLEKIRIIKNLNFNKLKNILKNEIGKIIDF